MKIEKCGYIYETDDYSKFNRLQSNRVVTDTRVKKLIKSFKEGEVLNPIVVNEKLEIIDGQGRYEAKKRLGLPIQFVVAKGASIKDCIRMNTYSANWDVKDYIKSFADSGNKNYQRLLIVMNDENITPKQAMRIVNCDYRRLKDGSLQFSDEDRTKVIEKVQMIKDIFSCSAVKLRLNDVLVNACMTMFQTPGYKHRKMLTNAKRYKIPQMGTVRDQLEALSVIYNKNNKDKLHFEDRVKQIEYAEIKEKKQEEDVSTLL